MKCPSVGPSHRVQSFRNRLIQHGLPMGSQPPSDIHLLRWCSLPWATGGYLLHCGLRGLQGNSLPHHGLHHELPGKTLCSIILNIFSPSFFTDLGVCSVVSLTSSHSSLSTAIFSPRICFGFFSVLDYVITEALPLSLIDLASSSGESLLEPASTGFIKHGGSFSQLLTVATPIDPQLPKPCHANP